MTKKMRSSVCAVASRWASSARKTGSARRQWTSDSKSCSKGWPADPRAEVAGEETLREHLRAQQDPLRGVVVRIEGDPEQRVDRAADADDLRTGGLVLGAAVVEELQHRVRQRDRTAVRAAGARLAPAYRFDDVVGGGASGVGELRPGASRVDAGMIVRPSDDALQPGRVPLGLDTVLLGEALDRRAVERLEHPEGQIVECLGSRSVLHLETAAQEQRLLDVLDRQGPFATVRPVLGAHQRVRHEVPEVIPRRPLGRDLAVDVSDHLVDVLPETVDLGELRLRHVGDRHVDVAPVLGERRRHFGADEDVALPGVEQLADAVDRVVIRQRDEGHAALLQEPVDLHRIGVRLGQRERVRRVVVRHIGGVRVEVEIHFAPARRFHWAALFRPRPARSCSALVERASSFTTPNRRPLAHQAYVSLR